MPDWYNREEVISYARALGKGMTVYKHPSRDNYNITHSSRTDLLSGYLAEGAVIVYET